MAAARLVARPALRRAFVDEERDCLFPGRNIAIDARSIPLFAFIVGTEFRFARQIAGVLFQIVIGFLVLRARRPSRFAWASVPSFLARPTLTTTAAAPAPATPAWPLRFLFGRSFVAFFDRSLVEGSFPESGLIGELVRISVTVTGSLEESLFGFVTRSFVAASLVAHGPLPIHRFSGSVSTRTRASPPASSATRSIAALFPVLGSALVRFFEFPGFF
jgi:hypothetical protein